VGIHPRASDEAEPGSQFSTLRATVTWLHVDYFGLSARRSSAIMGWRSSRVLLSLSLSLALSLSLSLSRSLTVYLSVSLPLLSVPSRRLLCGLGS